MATFDTWASYSYPPPNEHVLRNLKNYHRAFELRRFEYGSTAMRHAELAANPSLVGEHTFGADHLKSIHKHLFQDVYEWAGQYRTQNMKKLNPSVDPNERAMRGFGNVKNGEVDRYLSDAQKIIQRTDWPRLNRDQFATAAAEVFAHVNQAHPFREGNGRTSKTFMEHVAARSPFTLDFAKVDPQQWNAASARSAPNVGTYNVVPASLVPVFRQIATERPGFTPPSTAPAVSPERTPLSASFPKSPLEMKKPTSPAEAKVHRPGAGMDGPGRGVGK